MYRSIVVSGFGPAQEFVSLNSKPNSTGRTLYYKQWDTCENTSMKTTCTFPSRSRGADTNHATGRYNIEESSSPWMSSAVFVHKKNGDVRICIDYHALNKQTVKDSLCPMRFRTDWQATLYILHLTCTVVIGSCQCTSWTSPKLLFVQVRVWAFFNSAECLLVSLGHRHPFKD